MDEDAGVRVPVTRLRRRLSVEQSEESKSPALNTPTKKRGGRKTVKTDLELIDENATDNSTTKKTTKKTAKDVVDSVVEKPVTPSRRSTRIKSNTSILSETAIAVDSPRSKRATRRTSQVGSDSEAPPTPIRQTRRTRKDSTSSIEKGETHTSAKPAIQITEVIVEEPENSRKSTNNAETANKTSPSHLRKSPRLIKKSKKDTSNENENDTDQMDSNSSMDKSENTPSKMSVESPNTNSIEKKNEDNPEVQTSQNNRLSLSSSNLIKSLNTEAKTKSRNLNKSTSVIERNTRPKRGRTNSWTTTTVLNESNFYSDNEILKNKVINRNQFPLIKLNKFDLGNTLLNTSSHEEKSDDTKFKKKKKNSNSFVAEDIDPSLTNPSIKSIEKNNNETNTLPLPFIQNAAGKSDIITKLFEGEPSSNIKTMVYIEDDSDTNSGKANGNIHEPEDQCVQVIDHTNQLAKEAILLLPLTPDKTDASSNKSKDIITMNCSYEPMDVDETIPESLLKTEINKNEASSLEISQTDINDSIKEKVNKSKRKASITINMNKSEYENKSTLILSQLKDTSTGDINNVVKTPQTKNNSSAKPTDYLNSTQENDVIKRKLSINCATTSTPLQQKTLQNIVINTSMITSNSDVKDILKEDSDKSKNKSKLSNSVILSDEKSFQDNKSENINPISNDKSDLNNSEGSYEKSESTNKSINNKNKNFKNLSNNQSKDSDTDSESEDESITDERNNVKSKVSKSTKKRLSISSNDSETKSESKIESDDDSQTSNLLIDEAEDAGEDYESGDSQNEDERNYLKENEIIEKGVTLTSESELSDDNSYEKDSFVVSSEEEDKELLEGTDDDLSMSDNELKITDKSKKKYNERKDKEAKKASREMYESRHKLNISNKSDNSEVGKRKKSKPQQLSSSESEEENKEPRKSNRMRLDSSNDASMIEEIGNKISNEKALSKSICGENVLNEKEISICNESLKEVDPLSSNLKQEPKTPQTSNASIAFINSDNDPSNENELTRTQTEIVDPLDDSIGEDSLSDDSDNENITQNYDSILEGLNKSNKIKTKANNISLNIDKKNKKKEKTTIVNELNLTQVRSVKKAKKTDIKLVQKENKTVEANDDSESSDSIDLHLLFSEDSSNSDDVQNKKNNVSNSEQYIPLKRTEGKTNIQENKDSNKIAETINLSHNNKNKTKSETDSSDDADENSGSFFIDTEGAHPMSKNHNNSLKNNKKLFTEDNGSVDSDSEIQSKESERSVKTDDENKMDATETSDSDAPMDVPIVREKRTSSVRDEENDETDFSIDKSMNKSVTKTPASDKKKKKQRESQNSGLNDNDNNAEDHVNISLSSAKKKKKSIQVSENDLFKEETNEQQIIEKSLMKTPGSQKKKNRVSQINTPEKEEVQDDVPIEKSSNKTPKSDRKKKQQSFSAGDTQIDLIDKSHNTSVLKTPGSQKKKKITTDSQDKENTEAQDGVAVDKSFNKTPRSEKKKKHSYIPENDEIELRELFNTTKQKTPSSQKKKITTESLYNDEAGTSEQSLNNSKVKTPGSLKKNNVTDLLEENENEDGTDRSATIGSSKKSKKPHSNSFTTEIRSISMTVEPDNDTNKKKRKRKSSLIPDEETIAKDDQNTSKRSNESFSGSQKKKRKIYQNAEPSSIEVPVSEDNHLQSLNVSKEKKLKMEEETLLSNKNNTDVTKKKLNKKRKQREDEEEVPISKVFKENSFDKIHVPRLPASILNQLDDKPKRIPVIKKSKVTSTSQFSVVEARKRKNKPSHYLEESVYLNDDDLENKKQKKRLQKPKVLPFVPTASTSSSGYTTNFKVNIIPTETKFVAQSNTVSNFRDDYLYNKKIKRQGTYELYKRNRNIKMSKF